MDLITVSRKSDLEFGLRLRGHEVTSDMSEEDGGRDQGPSPSELLACSVGACIAMIVQAYCEARGYEGDVGVSMTLELADMPKRVGRLVVDLELPPSVPEDKKEAIMRVAQRCPIHQTFSHPPEIDIDIV